jgi:hypothetical protein
MRRHPSDAICSADLDGSIGYEPRDQELTHIIDCNAVAVRRNQNFAPAVVVWSMAISTRETVSRPVRNAACWTKKTNGPCWRCSRCRPNDRPVTSTWFDPTADARPKGSRR